MVLLIGNVLDKYEVLQKLGEGGMATVYRGRHVALGRDVAIKVLHPHLSSTERNRRRFAREARAIEDMDHDNILKIFDYSGMEASNCYIVTEFVDGVTLRELLTERGALPSEVATMLGIKLSEALSYAHRKKIIHRDLKPENVMLSRDGTVKLMDFGIAHFLDEMHLTLTGALVGSPAYMSPEQAMEREDIDQRSDLFSLGTLLFHLVSGVLPFSGSNPSIVLRNIIDGNRPHIMEIAPDISSQLGDVIEHLLQTNTDDRLFSADNVADALRDTLQDVSITPEQAGWSLQDWLNSQDAYEHRLNNHLTETLLSTGKQRLMARDHLGALGLFNRLLSIDEGNDEVLTLIQSMHSLHPEDDPQDNEPQRRWWVWLLPPLAAGVFTWLLWPTPQPEPPMNTTPSPAVPTRAHLASPPTPAQPVSLPPSQPTDAVEAPSMPITQPAVPDAQPVVSAVTTAPTTAPITAPIPDAAKETATDAVEEVEPSAEEAEQAPQPPGQVTVLVLESYGDIFIDDEPRGRTGRVGALDVTPGTHVLRVQNEYALPHTEEFTVGSGESKTLEITLTPTPAAVDLSNMGLSGDCQVFWDGSELGTSASMGFVVPNPQPAAAHELWVDCPDKARVVCDVRQARPGTTVRPTCP